MAIFADDFRDMMRQTVKVEPFLVRDQYNAPTYGAAKFYIARVNDTRKNIIGPDGQLIAIRGIAWLDTADPLSVDDRVTLPDGTRAKLVEVNAAPDETGGTAITRFMFQ